MEALYGFDSGRSKRAIAENRKIAEGLKEDKGFVYEVRFSLFVLNDIIYSVFRFFLMTMASERVYTTTL